MLCRRWVGRRQTREHRRWRQPPKIGAIKIGVETDQFATDQTGRNVLIGIVKIKMVAGHCVDNAAKRLWRHSHQVDIAGDEQVVDELYQGVRSPVPTQNDADRVEREMG